MIKIAEVHDMNLPTPIGRGYRQYFVGTEWRGVEPPLPGPDKVAEYLKVGEKSDAEISAIFRNLVNPDDPSLRKEAAQIVDEILRTHLFYEGVLPKILPQEPITPDDPRVHVGDADSLYVRVPRQLNRTEFERLPSFGSAPNGVIPGEIYMESRWVNGYFTRQSTVALKKDPLGMAAWRNYQLQDLIAKLITTGLAYDIDHAFFAAFFQTAKNAIDSNSITADQVFAYTSNPDNTTLPQYYAELMQMFADQDIPAGFFVVNSSTWMDVLKWGRSVTSDQLWGQILVNGIVFNHIYNVPVVVTNSKIIPRGVIYAVSTPQFLGHYFVLQPTKLHVVFDETVPEWKLYADQILALVLHNPLAIKAYSINPNFDSFTDLYNYYTS